mgnify:CR=1 FL=1
MKKYLIVGLGNVGNQYFETRHNIGFMVLNFFAKKNNLSFEEVKYGFISKYKLKGRLFIFLKPSTYMNLSGNAVSYWMKKENIDIKNLLVISDDLNLPSSNIRLRSGGSCGGHNGLLDIESKLNTKSYNRLRIGISNNSENFNQIEFVLGKLSENEQKELLSIFPNVCKSIISFVMDGIDSAMNSYN